MPVPVGIAELALECMTCFVNSSTVNSRVVEFTMPLECMESILLVESLCQSVQMGQWNEVNPNAKASLTPMIGLSLIWNNTETQAFDNRSKPNIYNTSTQLFDFLFVVV